jgi:hypothetical protein
MKNSKEIDRGKQLLSKLLTNSTSQKEEIEIMGQTLFNISLEVIFYWSFKFNA